MSSMENQNQSRWLIAVLFLSLTLALVLVRQNRSVSVTPDTTPEPPPVTNLDKTTLTGWLTIVYNGEQKYLLTDDAGETSELLINDMLLTRLGGPLAIDRTRVTIVGYQEDRYHDEIIVLTLKKEDDLIEE